MESPLCFVGKEKVVLQLKAFHSFQFSGYYAAIEKDFYADQNLEVVLSVTISKSVISLAQGISLEVLAEGIETEDQLAFLRR